VKHGGEKRQKGFKNVGYGSKHAMLKERDVIRRKMGKEKYYCLKRKKYRWGQEGEP
jgi:hypothetical protein